MTPVTIETTAQNSYYSAGNIGWSARSVFSYRTAIQQLTGNALLSIGNNNSNQAQAQSFTPGAAIDVSEIRVVVQKALAPTDNLALHIYSDTGANLPNVSIATADNMYAGASVSTTASWLAFQFSTPVALSASTKYWMVLVRSGALDASNYFQVLNITGNPYAGGGRSILVSGVWGAESATNDWAFQILTETPSALYSIVQDTSGLKLRAYKSTDSGSSWTEMDSANAPAVTNANYPYDACDTRSGPYLGTARMTGTNLMAVRVFNMSTDLWDGADWGVTAFPDEISNERSIRITNDNTFRTAEPGAMSVHMSSSLDDADLTFHRSVSAGTSWATGASAILSVTSTSASLVSAAVCDKSPIGFVHRFYYHVANSDFDMRSLTVVTSGAETILDATAADVETEHASAVYQIYQASNVDRIVAAYIAADGSIEERTATLEVTSGSVTLGTQHSVGTATTTAGRQLSTCEYEGDLYVVANVSGTGIDYYVDVGATGTWSAVTNWKTGLTNCTLSQALSIPGVGLAVVYTDNGTAVIDFIIVAGGGPVSKNDTDSIDVEVSETDAVAAALPETDSLAVTLTESETVGRINQRTDSDTAAITATETEAVAAAIAESDALAVTLTESEVVTHFLQKTDSDSLAISLTENDGVVAAAIADSDSAAVTAAETEAIAAALAELDSLAVTLTESETVRHDNQRADSDSLAVTLSELDAIAAALPDSDSLALTITESETVTRLVQKADTDSLAVTLSESESIDIIPGIVNKSDSDTLAVTATEVEAIVAALAESDSLAVTATESDGVAAAIPNADSMAVTITESEVVSRLIQKTDSDTLALTLTESESVDTTPEVIPKADTDSLAVTITESTGAVAAALAEADSLAITTSEVEAVRVFAADTDTADITLTESDAVRATLATETDSLAVTISESESVLKMRAKADTDSLLLTLTETSSVAKMIAKTDSDSLAVTITENTGAVAAQIADAETLAVEVADFASVDATLADVDALDITLGEVDQVHATIAESDVVVLVISETGIVTIGVPGDVEFELVAEKVLTFQTVVQDVLAYALEHGPALAMSVKGDYDGGN